MVNVRTSIHVLTDDGISWLVSGLAQAETSVRVPDDVMRPPSHASPEVFGFNPNTYKCIGYNPLIPP